MYTTKDYSPWVGKCYEIPLVPCVGHLSGELSTEPRTEDLLHLTC